MATNNLQIIQAAIAAAEETKQVLIDAQTARIAARDTMAQTIKKARALKMDKNNINFNGLVEELNALDATIWQSNIQLGEGHLNDIDPTLPTIHKNIETTADNTLTLPFQSMAACLRPIANRLVAPSTMYKYGKLSLYGICF